MQQITVGVREAKANLSKLLHYVRQGVEVVITDRSRPVGRIVPVSSQNRTLAERIADLENRGWLDPPKGKSMELPSLIPLTEGSAQRILQEDRESE